MHKQSLFSRQVVTKLAYILYTNFKHNISKVSYISSRSFNKFRRLYTTNLLTILVKLVIKSSKTYDVTFLQKIKFTLDLCRRNYFYPSYLKNMLGTNLGYVYIKSSPVILFSNSSILQG